MCEIEFARHRTPNRYGILLQVQIILPLDLILELHPGTHRAEVVFDHRYAPPVSDDVVMSRNNVETDVVFLAEELQLNEIRLRIIYNSVKMMMTM